MRPGNDDFAARVLGSWHFDPSAIAALLLLAGIYIIGWWRGRSIYRDGSETVRLAAFLCGLLLVFFALESPLDTFDHFYLWAHMTQHLILMMLAPPLILVGKPAVPLLRGLPRELVKEGLVPFMSWPTLRRALRFFTQLPIAWLCFAASTILWHLPRFYELALSSPFWHAIQHASFFWTGILFWWPVIEAKRHRAAPPRWIIVPYLLLGDILNTALSAYLIFSDQILYPTYASLHLGGLSPHADQAAAGAIMWVPGSLVYLIPAIAIAARQFAPGRPVTRIHQLPPRNQNPPGLIQISTPKRSRLPALRRAAQVVMLVIAAAVIYDGFRGPQISGLNLAGILPWVEWRGLSIIALVLVGNLFCMVCPFTLVRDAARLLGAKRARWPRFLQTKWLPASLILIYLWAYEAFDLWKSPHLTAWIIVSYFAAILIVDTYFRDSNFCKFVCPIGQFHFVASLISPVEIGVKSAAKCHSCRTYDCIRGNAQSHGCELNLFQPRKLGNTDCTFCLDCIKACPHENVGFVPSNRMAWVLNDERGSSIGRAAKRIDVTALAMVVVFGAFVNAAMMTEPVMSWMHSIHALLGPGGMPALTAGFVLSGALVLPLLALVVCWALNQVVARTGTSRDQALRLAMALVPLGISMWAAHLFFHLVSGGLAPLDVTSRFLTAHASSNFSAWPPNVRVIQILTLDAGLLFTLLVLWRVCRQTTNRFVQDLALLAPWAGMSALLYSLGIWILLQPMAMRGVMQ